MPYLFKIKICSVFPVDSWIEREVLPAICNDDHLLKLDQQCQERVDTLLQLIQSPECLLHNASDLSLENMG